MTGTNSHAITDESWPANRGMSSYFVSIVSTAEAAGVRCEEKALDTDILGVAIRRVGQTPQVYVNAGLAVHARRLAIARCLGHLALEGEGSEELISIDRAGQDSSLADSHARSLLMPEGDVRSLRSHGASVSEMALTFDVGISDAQRRLRDLGLS